MRDAHGRYKELKAISDNGPEWAKGCEHCEFGIILAPPLSGIFTLSDQRAVMANDGEIAFCDCRAAFMQRQYLRKVYVLMGSQRNEHIRQELAANATTPTIHLEPMP